MRHGWKNVPCPFSPYATWPSIVHGVAKSVSVYHPPAPFSVQGPQLWMVKLPSTGRPAMPTSFPPPLPFSWAHKYLHPFVNSCDCIYESFSPTSFCAPISSPGLFPIFLEKSDLQWLLHPQESPNKHFIFKMLFYCAFYGRSWQESGYGWVTSFS